MINIENLKPFPKFCCSIGMIPTSYKVSLTYEEQLLWVCDFLENTVIPTVNNNGQAVEELQNLFVTLTNYVDNYFDNLDVQEEINNKLDEMVEDGTLQEIIGNYLNSKAIFGFDNVDSMKNATNLINGSYAETLGYYNKNDGGGAIYKISDTQPTNYYETLNNGLYAEIIITENMNILQFGAKGDGTTDNTNAIQNALNTKAIITIPKSNNVYNITSSLTIYNDIIFENYVKMINPDGSFDDCCLNVINYRNNNFINIINPLIDGGRDITQSYSQSLNEEYSHGINIKGSKNINIIGGNIKNCQGDNICISASEENRYSENININNVLMDYPYRNNVSIISGVNIKLNNCISYNRNGYRNLLIEPNNDNSLKNENIVIDGGYYYGNNSVAVLDIFPTKNVKDVVFKNITIENGTQNTCPIRISASANETVDNLTLKNINIINSNNNMQLIINTSNNLDIDNIKINSRFNSLNIVSKNINFINSIIKNELLGTINLKSDYLKMINNIIDGKHSLSTIYVINLDILKNIIISNNIFKSFVNMINLIGGTSENQKTTDSVTINDNVFNGTASTGSVSRCIHVETNLTIDNLIANNINYDVNNEFYNQGIVKYASGNNVSKTKIIYGTSAPNDGQAYNRGDICYNTQPSGGSYIGWVCTIAGTPGNWQPFGAISN